MKADTTRKMASILNVTDSAYYPTFKSMFRNVVAALNESLDITMHLRPLAGHYEVGKRIRNDKFVVCLFLRLLRPQTLLTSVLCLRRSCTRFFLIQIKDGVLLLMKKDGVLLLMKKVRNLNQQFHLQMCLVYSSSEFYNTTDRIIVLMQVFPLLSLLVVF